MAAEDIGVLYNTKIPSYADPADIQEALRLYHYGTTDPAQITNQLKSAIVEPSIAYWLKTIQEAITALEAQGVGGIVSSTKPTGAPEGFIWMDSSSSSGSSAVLANIAYTATEPSSPSNGQLWVVKGSSPLIQKIYDADTSTWKTIGA